MRQDCNAEHRMQQHAIDAIAQCRRSFAVRADRDEDPLYFAMIIERVRLDRSHCWRCRLR